MQVSVEAGEGLERKLTVQIPAETVESEVNNRLNSLKNTVRVDGFRPGKVPLKIIRQRYASTVLNEVAGELMHRTFQEALAQENLNPAGDPERSPHLWCQPVFGIPPRTGYQPARPCHGPIR